MGSKPAQLVQHYRQEGLDGVARAVQDYAYYKIRLHKLIRTAELDVGSVSVSLVVNDQEALWRARGHGEEPVLEAFVEAIDAEDVVWDVGANMGSYALLAAKAGAEVVAFEPGAEARAQLVANAERNGLDNEIDPVPIALSDESGTATLSRGNKTATRALSGGSGTTVPVERGDEVDVPSPDVVKIDVEGTEVAVLDGMEQRLAAVRECFVEVHNGVSDEDVRNRLEEAGLAVSQLDAGDRGETFLRGQRE